MLEWVKTGKQLSFPFLFYLIANMADNPQVNVNGNNGTLTPDFVLDWVLRDDSGEPIEFDGVGFIKVN